MIDSHCHLQRIKEDPASVLLRAREAGLESVLQVAIQLESSLWGLELSKKELPLPIYPTAGLYPSEAKRPDWIQDLAPLDTLLQSKNFVALGEVGLDRYWDESYMDAQKALLRAQIDLALEHDLPIILHCRKAFEDLLEVVNDFYKNSRFRAVWHCFDGEVAQAQAMLDRGVCLSLTGIFTYPSSKALREVVKRLPSSSFMLESDAPYLSPLPMRGKPNEPAYIAHSLDFLAELWGRDKKELEIEMDQKTRAFFSLEDIRKPICQQLKT